MTMDRRLAQLPCGILSLNTNYEILEVNETFLEWTKYQNEQLIGMPIEKLFPAGNKLIFHSYVYPNMSMHKHVEELFIHIYTATQEKMPFLLNAKEVQFDGETMVDIVLMPMKKRIDYEHEIRNTKLLLEKAYVEKNKAFDHLHHIYEQIEQKQLELIQINSQLVEISNTDKLTGIANRRSFQQQLETHIGQFHDEGLPFSLLIIDIDYFKKVNDTYGHQVGDMILAQLAMILQQEARATDTVARFGGEEFTILLGQTKAAEAMAVAQKLIEQVESAHWPTIGRLTISIGCATFKESDTESTLLQHADEALYESKHNGRNQATQYEESKSIN